MMSGEKVVISQKEPGFIELTAELLAQRRIEAEARRLRRQREQGIAVLASSNASALSQADAQLERAQAMVDESSKLPDFIAPIAPEAIGSNEFKPLDMSAPHAEQEATNAHNETVVIAYKHAVESYFTAVKRAAGFAREQMEKRKKLAAVMRSMMACRDRITAMNTALEMLGEKAAITVSDLPAVPEYSEPDQLEQALTLQEEYLQIEERLAAQLKAAQARKQVADKLANSSGERVSVVSASEASEAYFSEQAEVKRGVLLKALDKAVAGTDGLINESDIGFYTLAIQSGADFSEDQLRRAVGHMASQRTDQLKAESMLSDLAPLPDNASKELAEIWHSHAQRLQCLASGFQTWTASIKRESDDINAKVSQHIQLATLCAELSLQYGEHFHMCRAADTDEGEMIGIHKSTGALALFSLAVDDASGKRITHAEMISNGVDTEDERSLCADFMAATPSDYEVESLSETPNRKKRVALKTLKQIL
jgi:hypothetical protein